MSYQEKNITVSLFSSTLVLVIFLMRVIPMYIENELYPVKVFSLWGMVIVLSIVANIVGNILTHIAFAIIQSIQQGRETCEEEAMIEDERDKLIELKGSKAAYVMFSFGVFVAMLTMILGQPPLVMFSLLIFSAFAAQICGDLARLYRYRRGF